MENIVCKVTGKELLSKKSKFSCKFEELSKTNTQELEMIRKVNPSYYEQLKNEFIAKNSNAESNVTTKYPGNMGEYEYLKRYNNKALEEIKSKNPDYYNKIRDEFLNSGKQIEEETQKETKSDTNEVKEGYTCLFDQLSRENSKELTRIKNQEPERYNELRKEFLSM